MYFLALIYVRQYIGNPQIYFPNDSHIIGDTAYVIHLHIMPFKDNRHLRQLDKKIFIFFSKNFNLKSNWIVENMLEKHSWLFSHEHYRKNSWMLNSYLCITQYLYNYREPLSCYLVKLYDSGFTNASFLKERKEIISFAIRSIRKDIFAI